MKPMWNGQDRATQPLDERGRRVTKMAIIWKFNSTPDTMGELAKSTIPVSSFRSLSTNPHSPPNHERSHSLSIYT